MSALVAGLRRAGSTHSLCVAKNNSSSRSLPPSPSHTPRYEIYNNFVEQRGELGTYFKEMKERKKVYKQQVMLLDLVQRLTIITGKRLQNSNTNHNSNTNNII